MLSLSFFLVLLMAPGISRAEKKDGDPELICRFNIGGHKEDLIIREQDLQSLGGRWIVPRNDPRYKVADFEKGISGSKDAFLSPAPAEFLICRCYQGISSRASFASLYFLTLDEIQVRRKGHLRCHGHALLTDRGGRLCFLYKDQSQYLRKKLADYNFSVVLEGMVYRSGKLGKEGMKRVFSALERAASPAPKSIASIHVMGYGGPGGSYNLEEMTECKRKGLKFLHSYHHDPAMTVYMDGTDPSHIDEHDPDHGNIYRHRTVMAFIPDPAVRSSLKVGEGLQKGRVLRGDTMDFLHSVENMVDAPWPLLIHCKGGRHKTGMFSLVFEYLAWQLAMNAEVGAEEVSIPLYKTRLAEWFRGRASVPDIFFAGPMYGRFRLSPAEQKYASHNKSVFRQENLHFIRSLVAGELFTSDALRKKWELIGQKFLAKVAGMPRNPTVQKILAGQTARQVLSESVPQGLPDTGGGSPLAEDQ